MTMTTHGQTPQHENEDVSMQAFYSCPPTERIQEQCAAIDELKARIDGQKPLDPSLWKSIQNKLRISWTYDSNAIEGSTLTRNETAFFLEEGLTVAGRPLKDFLDAKNHAAAIDWLYEVIDAGRPVGERFVKDINALLLDGVSSTRARTPDGHIIDKDLHPGQYKRLPNHVLRHDGSIHHYVDPLQVQPQMRALFEWAGRSQYHPGVVAAIAHFNFVRIHPFDDGNGRGARILMNTLLIKSGHVPAVVRVEDRQPYLAHLETADRGDLAGFVGFILDSLRQTQQVIAADLGAPS